MTEDARDARVVRDDGSRRYELHVDGARVGVLTFDVREEALALLHTEVDPGLEGRGWGSRLVADALADVRRRGEQILPVCPFVVAYLRQHPESADLVPAAQRAAFGLG